MALKLQSRKESGIGFCVALLQWVVFIYGWPKLSAYYWPSFVEFKNDNNMSDAGVILLFGIGFQTVMLVIGNCAYFFCYKTNLTFFEKYKCVEDPWPWETDPVEWNRLFWRSIMFSSFNLFVVLPIFSIPGWIFDAKITASTDFSYPTELQFLA